MFVRHLLLDWHAMTFIECFPGEDDSALSQAAQEASTSVFPGGFPVIGFGRLIEWKDRLFREVRVAVGSDMPLQAEECLFLTFVKNRKRATIQLGSMNGIAFQTPPSPGAEIIARVIDQGRHSTVSPFIYAEKA
jgi:hypothetical protein